MHVFQPYPIYMLDWNPFDKIGRDSMAVVVESGEKHNVTATKNAYVGSFMGKNVLGVFIPDSLYTKEVLDESELFSGCFMDLNDHNNKRIMKIVNLISGRDEDKLAACKLNMAHSMNIPYIDEANFVILCKKIAAIPVTPEMLLADDLADKFLDVKPACDSYTLYIGEIKDIMVR